MMMHPRRVVVSSSLVFGVPVARDVAERDRTCSCTAMIEPTERYFGRRKRTNHTLWHLQRRNRQNQVWW